MEHLPTIIPLIGMLVLTVVFIRVHGQTHKKYMAECQKAKNLQTNLVFAQDANTKATTEISKLIKEIEKLKDKQKHLDAVEMSVSEMATDMKNRGYTFLRIDPDTVLLRK